MGEKKQNSKSKKSGKIARGFQAFGIWFRDTAWIQVVLVVVVVFAIVFSIPYIVNAINTDETDDEKTATFLKDRRKTYDELNKAITNTKKEFTVVYYYDGSTSSDTVGNMMRKNIFESNVKYYDNTLFGNYLVTIDISRLKENNDSDYDLTRDQLQDIGTIYDSFYSKTYFGKEGDYSYKDSATGKITKYFINSSDWNKNAYKDLGGFSDGYYKVPTGLFAVYKNASDNNIASTDPIWMDVSIENTGNDTDFMDELIASLNYNIPEPTNPNKILVIK